MKKLLAGAACAIASLPALAGDWSFIGYNETFLDFVDVSSKVQKGDTVSLWTLRVINKSSVGIAYILMLSEYDCKQQTVSHGETIAYDTKGGVLGRTTEATVSRAVPGSNGRTSLDLVCKGDLQVDFKDVDPTVMARSARLSLIVTDTWD